MSTVKSAAASLTFDPAGCPQLDDATSTALVNQLKSDETGGAGSGGSIGGSDVGSSESGSGSGSGAGSGDAGSVG